MAVEADPKPGVLRPHRQSLARDASSSRCLWSKARTSCSRSTPLPAVIAVTRDPFIAFSSNAVRDLGVRSLYFVMAPMIERFRYMKQSLIFLLAFIGVKMLLTTT